MGPAPYLQPLDAINNCWESLFQHQIPTLFFKLFFEVATERFFSFNIGQDTSLGKGNGALTRLC